MTEVILIHKVFYDATGKYFCYYMGPRYKKRRFGSVYKNLDEFKTIWTCPINVLDLKRTQAKMSFTVYMQIEPSATEKVNF